MNHVFVTGVTGVLGSALVPWLLKSKDTTLYLLIRGKDKDHVKKRLEELKYFWGSDVDPGDYHRLCIYCGDAGLSGFGLEATEYKYLLETITHIIHSAASVKLDMSQEEAMHAVYTPSHVVLGFAKELHVKGQLKKFDYVSTLGVAGKMLGAIPEIVLPERKFHNTYESTKSLCEMEVLDAHKSTRMPVTIHRPSMIIGDGQTGKIVHFQGFYFLASFLSGQKSFGFLPNLENQNFDLIPSDYAARIIAWSNHAGQETLGKILHLCAGPDHAISYKGLIERIQQNCTNNGEHVRKITFVHPFLFLIGLYLLAIVTVNKKVLRSANGLALYYRHLKTVQIFENKKTLHLLKDAGIPVLSLDTYLGKALNFWRATKKKSFPGK